MTFVQSGIRRLDRAIRTHALLFAGACGVILVVGFTLPQTRWLSLLGTNEKSSRNEAAFDSALQRAATDALGGREGTIIVMDPHTGRVRALVNPQAAFAQAQMPGSAIKPFTALAALRAGVIAEDSRSVCPGRFTGLSFSLPCVHANSLPPFSPAQAIAYSCNYYFATLGQRLGRERLVATAREFGFGQLTGFDTEEVAGVARPCETGTNTRIRTAESNHVSAQADCEAREAVGESDHLQVTPIQLLTAYVALINGGHLYQPGVAGAESFRAVERAQLSIASAHRAVIAEGMAGAVRYGTARKAKLDSLPLTILGKTGTALPAKGFRNNGWFIGLAGPFQSTRELGPSQVDLAVLVLLSRAHGSEAAVIARPIFETYANLLKQPESGPTSTSTKDAPGLARPPAAASASVRVHLVHDNVTQELPLEDYVLGVVRAEGSTESEPEALKALAIAVRTFALKNSGRHARDGYDFCSTTHCQRFSVRSPTVREGLIEKGTLADGPAATRMLDAVQATAGQLLFDDRGQIAAAYFGASCGGETANIGDLWGGTPPEYLRGVRDEYCLSGPHAHWRDVISRANLLRALQSDARTDVGSRLDQVVISKRDDSGRVESITLDGEQRKSVRGWDFKIIVGRALGWNVLKSSRFDVARAGSNFIFAGSGFGHGLGLCQEGAHVMAARGSSYQKILEKYFPGTRVALRSGDMSLARPSKAGYFEPNAQLVASATIESARAQPNWRADLFPGPKYAPTMAEYSIRGHEPRSGEMFIAREPKTGIKLRRSEIFPAVLFDEHSYFAPLELANLVTAGFYKHLVPTGLNPRTRFLSISSEHFRVTYPPDVERRDADHVLNTLESARSDFTRRASMSSLSPGIPFLEIRLNESTGDFTARTGQPWWAAAATRGNRIEMQPHGLLKRRGVLFTTLRHELAHVFINAVSRDRAPRWLEEGFAIYLAGEGKLFTPYSRRGALLTEQLEQKMERPSSQQEMRALYAQAYLDVFQMVRAQGEASVWKKLAAG